MRLLELQVENFMRVKFALLKFDPDGHLFVVGGGNGEGKTSIQKGAIACLGGKLYTPEEPVRRGAETAQVIVRMDKLVVTRIIQPSRESTYKIETPDGKPYPGGSQKMLMDFVRALTFDPEAFVRMQPRDQADALRKLTGLDFTRLDLQRKALYDERAVAGRDVTGRKGQLETMPTYPDAPPEEVSVADLGKELQAANEKNKQGLEAMNHLEIMRGGIEAINEKLANADKQLKAWQAQIAKLTEEKSEKLDMLLEYRKRAESMKVIDTAPILARMQEADALNAQVRANDAHATMKATFEQAKGEYDRLTKDIEYIDKTKQDMVAKAKMPIKGLGFSESGVTFKGMAFDQCSSAEQLRVSVAVGLASNPDFPNAFVRDGSLLDEKSLKIVGEVAAAANGFVLLERVGHGKECDVVIQDGQVDELYGKKE